MNMPDGNTAALRLHEASQARAEREHETYAPLAINAIVYDVLDGYGIKGVGYPPRTKTAGDFIADDGVEMWLDHHELAALICGGDYAESVRDKLRLKLETKVREWCDGPGSEVVAERIANMAEDE